MSTTTGATVPLRALASTVRSKNAKPYRLTLDVIFTSEEYFRYVLATDALTAEAVAEAYGVTIDAITSSYVFEAGLAVKFTLRRSPVQGAMGETDMYGAQQHVPLLNLPIPWDGSLPLPDVE